MDKHIALDLLGNKESKGTGNIDKRGIIRPKF